VTDDECDAVVAADRGAERATRVLVLVDVPDGAVAAREDDGVVLARVHRGERLRVVEVRVVLVHVHDAFGGVRTDLFGVDRPVVDDRRITCGCGDVDVDAGVLERGEWFDALLAPVPVLADEEQSSCHLYSVGSLE